MKPTIIPVISAVITIPWVRGTVLGLRFGTPIPTQIRLCYHPEQDHWLEFSDGTRADVVASRYPEEIRQARLEMMTSFHRREVISSTYHRRKSEAAIKPPTDRESRPRMLREGISQMTSTEAIRRAGIAPNTNAPPLKPVAEAAPEPAVPESATMADPFEGFDQFSEPLASPPPPAVTQSSVFAVRTERTARRLDALRATRPGQNP